MPVLLPDKPDAWCSMLHLGWLLGGDKILSHTMHLNNNIFPHLMNDHLCHWLGSVTYISRPAAYFIGFLSTPPWVHCWASGVIIIIWCWFVSFRGSEVNQGMGTVTQQSVSWHPWSWEKDTLIRFHFMALFVFLSQQQGQPFCSRKGSKKNVVIFPSNPVPTFWFCHLPTLDGPSCHPLSKTLDFLTSISVSTSHWMPISRTTPCIHQITEVLTT